MVRFGRAALRSAGGGLSGESGGEKGRWDWRASWKLSCGPSPEIFFALDHRHRPPPSGRGSAVDGRRVRIGFCTRACGYGGKRTAVRRDGQFIAHSPQENILLWLILLVLHMWCDPLVEMAIYVIATSMDLCPCEHLRRRYNREAKVLGLYKNSVRAMHGPHFHGRTSKEKGSWWLSAGETAKRRTLVWKWSSASDHRKARGTDSWGPPVAGGAWAGLADPGRGTRAPCWHWHWQPVSSHGLLWPRRQATVRRRGSRWRDHPGLGRMNSGLWLI